MVARSESMFGCYDSYSYRLWSLANVWSSTCHFPAINGNPKEGESDSKFFIKCSQCHEGYPGFQALKEHVESVHPQGAVSDEGSATPQPLSAAGSPPLEGAHVCISCPASFSSKDQLEKHELQHSLSAQVSCKVCNKTFANVYRLQRHMISHDESALLRKFKCTDCDKAFKFKHHLKEHVRIHSGEKPFGCTNCGKRFSHSGSYSSHMTSKKCISMSLKLNRGLGNPNVMAPEKSPSRKRHSAPPQINNNTNTSPNNNKSFLPILPKYEAAAAFLASISPRDGPFPGMQPGLPGAGAGAGGIPPYFMNPLQQAALNYRMPPNLSHLLEQLHANSPHRQMLEASTSMEHKRESSSLHSDPEDMIEEITEEDDKKELYPEEHRQTIKDVEDHARVNNNEEKREMTPHTISRASPGAGSNSGGLGGLNMILENVNASVTKQLLEANMHKLSSPAHVTDYRSEGTSPLQNLMVKEEQHEEVLECSQCRKTFNHKTELIQHEKVLCGSLFRKHEGLAAQMAETLALKAEYISMQNNGSLSGSEDDNDDREYIKDEDKLPSENERKIRVRTAISDEQQAILKEHYALNQRPNREEFKRIAERLGLDNRVVQVWFQNNRARERRLNQNITYSDQPLDLSIKKEHLSATSTPSSSPTWPTSVNLHSDSGEEVVNLSQKSSRSPTPYRQPNRYQTMSYQHSNGSSSSLVDFRRSPSPSPLAQDMIPSVLSNGHLARRLSQPIYRFPSNTPLGLVPMERLLQFNTANRSPLLGLQLAENIRASSSSPGSGKRSWKLDEDTRISHDMDHEDEHVSKKANLSIKSEGEAEGQFVCDQCDKAFSKQSSLARHKYEHSGQRPYKCIECPKAFKHKHHLTEHKRLHSGEKPFQCCKCLKRFSHSGSYSQHMNHRYSYCKPYRE